jgi:hypothetical protein
MIFVLGHGPGERVVETVTAIGIISVVIECVVIRVEVVDSSIITTYPDSALYILIERKYRRMAESSRALFLLDEAVGLGVWIIFL